MKLTKQAQTIPCPSCRVPILATNWDDLEGLTADITADPTPLTPPLELACVLAGRPIYALEATVVNTYRLSRLHGHNRDRQLINPIATLPAHICGGRFPNLPALDLTTAIAATPDQPGWEKP